MGLQKRNAIDGTPNASAWAHGLEVSPDFIGATTDEVMDEVTDWQDRPVETLYPLVVFDALRVQIRDQGTVQNRAVHRALGIRADGQEEVLGLWIEANAGAKFWLKVLTDLSDGSERGDTLLHRGTASLTTEPDRFLPGKPRSWAGVAGGFRDRCDSSGGVRQRRFHQPAPRGRQRG